MTPLSFRVLGPVEVADAVGAPVKLGGGRRTLLALLLSEPGRVVAMDRIVEALWHGDPPPSAHGVVLAHVSHLRRALDPGRTGESRIATRAPGYVFTAAPGELDALRFTELVAEGERALGDGDAAGALRLLDEALTLWRGRPFAGIDADPELDLRVAELEEQRLRLLELRAEALLRRGRAGEAAAEAETLVRERPLRERSWELLMRARYRDGRQADALAAYQDCRDLLDAELGLEPGPALRDLQLAVLRRDPALDAVPAPVAPEPEGRLVGRERELAAIADAVAGAVRGAGRMVLLEGEAGIGKTSVAEAGAARAREVRVVWARTVEDLAAPALWLWEQILADLGLPARQAPAADDGADPAVARFRMLEGTTRALLAAARERPLLLVLEDLHWADAGSLQVLRLLAARLGTASCSIVATTRTADAADPAALDAALSALGRERAVRRMALAPFSLAEVEEFLGEDRGHAGALREKTGGNPFFLTEMVRLLSAPDAEAGPVPSTVRDVVEHRFQRLPVATRRVLRLAALAGADLDPRVLGHAVAAEVTEALEPALRAGLLQHDPDDWSWRFAHDIARDALASALSPAHRAELHRLLADAVAAVHGSDARHAEELARHRFHAARGGPSEAAYLACTAAADLARRRLAPDQAARHRERALAALPPGDDRRFDALIALMEEQRQCGDVLASFTTLEEALAEAGEDRERAARAAGMLGGVTLWNWRPYGFVDHAMADRLHDLLTDPHGPRRRAELLGALAVELYYGPARLDGRSEALAAEAVGLAREVGDAELLGRTLNNYVMAAWTPQADDRRLAVLDESLAMAGRGLPRATEVIARMHRLTLHLRHGRAAEYRADLEICAELAPTLGVTDIEVQTDYKRATLAALHCDWETAEEIGGQAFRTHRRTSMWGALFASRMQRVAIAYARGRDADLAALADELAEAAAREENGVLRPTAVRLLADLGEHTHARTLVRRWGLDLLPDARDWHSDFGLAELGAVAALLGVPDPAAAYRKLLPFQDRLVVAGSALACRGSFHGVLADLADRLGDEEAAARHRAAPPPPFPVFAP
ncbi:BTAD domain-containing putative transcriptional regulator [Actinocorallia aurea]